MRGDNAVRLRLPAGDRRHPTLNLDKLKLWTDGMRSHPHRHRYAAAAASLDAAAPAAAVDPPSFEYINSDNEPVYEAESILDRMSENGLRLYRVKWRGYGEDEATWQFAEDLAQTDLVQQFEAQQQQRPARAAVAAPRPHPRR